MVFQHPDNIYDKDFNLDSHRYFEIPSNALLSNQPTLRTSSPHDVPIAEHEDNLPVARIETLPPLSPMPPSLFNTTLLSVERSQHSARSENTTVLADSLSHPFVLDHMSPHDPPRLAYTPNNTSLLIGQTINYGAPDAPPTYSSAPFLPDYTPNYNYTRHHIVP